MKDLSEQIKEILDDELFALEWEYGAEMDGIDEATDRITALINDNYVPREFVNWMGRVGISYITHAYREENKGKYQRVILKEDNEFEITQYTLDELFEYWKTINEK